MKNWLLKFLLKEGIKEMDQLKPLIVAKIVQAQTSLSAIPPEQFADTLITEIQVAICNKVGIVPGDIGIKEI